jgi:hypothetical protein
VNPLVVGGRRCPPDVRKALAFGVFSGKVPSFLAVEGELFDFVGSPLDVRARSGRRCTCAARGNPEGKPMIRHACAVLGGVVLLGSVLTACGPVTFPVTTDPSGAPASTGTAGPTTGRVQPGSGLPAGDKSSPMPGAGKCQGRSKNGQPLPDPGCTPGAVDPTVTQDDIGSTVCKTGWTKTARPPSSVTDRMKAASARSYGLPASAKGEYDHLVPLELGGAPDDPRNLWVEVGSIPNPKDAVENKLNAAVCAGLIPLAAAQKAIAADWVNAFDDAGLRVAGGKVCLRANPAKCAGGR